MKSSDKSSIFDGLSQLMDDIDPTRIVPLVDRVLVRDLGEQEKVGSLFVPQTAAERGAGKHGLMRMCEVVAVGPGDKWRESKPDAVGEVKRRVVTVWKTCEACDGDGNLHLKIKTTSIMIQEPGAECRKCGGRKGGRVPGRLPMEVKVGDQVLVDRRKDLEIFIRGDRYSLVNAEQSILAVVE